MYRTQGQHAHHCTNDVDCKIWLTDYECLTPLSTIFQSYIMVASFTEIKILYQLGENLRKNEYGRVYTSNNSQNVQFTIIQQRFYPKKEFWNHWFFNIRNIILKWRFCTIFMIIHQVGLSRFKMFNATFNNISVISWRSVSLVEETGVPRENHRPVASHWQTLSHNVVSSTPRHEQGSNSQL